MKRVGKLWDKVLFLCAVVGAITIYIGGWVVRICLNRLDWYSSLDTLWQVGISWLIAVILIISIFCSIKIFMKSKGREDA